MNNICFYMAPYPKVKSYFDLIDCSVEHGLDHLEGFCRFELEEPDIEAAKKIKEYADKKGVRFSCFSVFINLVGEDAPDMMVKLKGFADVCKILECPYLHHTIVNNFYDPDLVLNEKEENYKKGLLAVREIYDYAEKLGVKTIYEDQGYIFNGIDGFGKFLKEVDRAVGVVADFGNIYQVGGTAEEFIDAFGHLALHAHIKNVSIKESNESGDGLRTTAGKYMFEDTLLDGCVDCKKMVELLKAKGYKGDFGLEFGAIEDDSDYMRESIAEIKSWF